MFLTALGALGLCFIGFAIPAGEAQTKPRNRVVASDCGFLRDPDAYLGSAGRRLTAASRVTEEISSQVYRGKTDFAAAYEEVPYRNFIDQFLFDKMRADRIPHAGLADDATFLRRVTLDLTGRTPSPDEVRSFLMDASADKRDQVIDRLMNSSEFVDRWTLFFGDLYRNTDLLASNNVNRTYEGRNAFHRWLRQAIADRWPYNDMVTAILTATGNTFETGPANWTPGSITPMGPLQDTYDTLAVQTAAQFLGISAMDCLLCHNGAGHLNLLSLWGSRATRMEGWQLSAYFSRVNNARQTANANNNAAYLVTERAAGNYDLGSTFGNRPNRTIEGTTRTVTPKYIFSNATATGNYRQALAQALTSDPQFARATVNYLWAELMGLGLVDPPDQFDPARLDPKNPPPAPWTLQPSNPELLQALATDFVNSGFNLRHTIRLIVSSSAYQLSSRFPGTWKAGYTPYHARHIVRRLKAEEVHDAIIRATGTTASYALRGFDQPVAWAMQLPDVREPNRTAALTFLDNFLRGNRDNLARSDEVTITQTLTLMNDTFVITRVRSTASTSLVRRLLAAGRTNSQMVDELFLSALSRYPTSQEQEAALRRYTGTATVDQRAAASEDLLWALLNKVDFLFNY
jgi:hypothetical protein